jgi:hypothetical protein
MIVAANKSLAYRDMELVTAVKSFMSLAPGTNAIKLFTAVIYEFL